MTGVGLPELALMIVIALFLFGPSKLPHLGRSLGGAITNFKKTLSDSKTDRIEKT